MNSYVQKVCKCCVSVCLSSVSAICSKAFLKGSLGFLILPKVLIRVSKASLRELGEA